MSVAGDQVALHKDRLLPVFRQIAAEHVAVCDECDFPPDIAEQILCDVSEAFERRQVRKEKKAA